MFCPDQNSYLQLVCAMDPRTINKTVRRAMIKKMGEPEDEDELPPAPVMSSMQPLLFGSCIDVLHSHLGYDRIGLRIILREIHSNDILIQLQAINVLLDQVQIPENALFLIELNVINRLIDLMTSPNHIAREKVTFTLTHLANYSEGRKKISSQPLFTERLIHMFTRDRKAIRYAAAYCLKTFTRYRCCCSAIMQNDDIIESLLKMIKNDHTLIVILHLNSLKNLSEWDPVKPLKANAFQVMRKLMIYHQYRIAQVAIDVMTQLCKHEVGKRLADKYDLTKVLQSYLVSPDIEVIVSAVCLMKYTTLTSKSLWRTKEFAFDLTKRLVALCVTHNTPVLQLYAMQVLTNLCESPDIRKEMQSHKRKIVKAIMPRNHEQWDNTSTNTTFVLKTGCNYNTMSIENVDVIKEDWGANAKVVEVQSYQTRIRRAKKNLFKALLIQPHTH